MVEVEVEGAPLQDQREGEQVTRRQAGQVQDQLKAVAKLAMHHTRLGPLVEEQATKVANMQGSKVRGQEVVGLLGRVVM